MTQRRKRVSVLKYPGVMRHSNSSRVVTVRGQPLQLGDAPLPRFECDKFSGLFRGGQCPSQVSLLPQQLAKLIVVVRLPRIERHGSFNRRERISGFAALPFDPREPIPRFVIVRPQSRGLVGGRSRLVQPPLTNFDLGEPPERLRASSTQAYGGKNRPLGILW